MFLHKEGIKTILLSSVILVLLLFSVSFLFSNYSVFQYSIVAFCLLVYGLILYFFRNVKRTLQPNPNYVFSPADGKVVVIEKVFDDEFFNDERIQISIFMSPLNVHINWYPVSGTILYTKYNSGKYLVAWHPKSSSENERTTTVIETTNGQKILVKQIAGAVARRIVNYASLNTSVIQGNELGFIKFGSRVDLLLPLHSKINVVLNQRVWGSKTIIAEI